MEFVLENRRGDHLVERLRVPDGEGNSWLIETQDDTIARRRDPLASQVHNGRNSSSARPSSSVAPGGLPTGRPWPPGTRITGDLSLAQRLIALSSARTQWTAYADDILRPYGRARGGVLRSARGRWPSGNHRHQQAPSCARSRCRRRHRGQPLRSVAFPA